MKIAEPYDLTLEKSGNRILDIFTTGVQIATLSLTASQ